MLVPMKDILDRASAANYAVVAPNVNTEFDARIALEAAEEAKAPIILNVHYDSNPDIIFFGSYLTRLCEMSNVPVAINLDHGATFEQAVKAIRAGFTSIMIDRSSLPYEENVAEVAELTKIAHSVGVSVEAELGYMGFGEVAYTDGGKLQVNAATMTDPDMALDYIQRTGCDCLAVAIGTAHGAYVSTPFIDFDRLEKIKKVTGGFPLVIHGGSGTGEANLRKACSMGINKVNIYNDLMRGACDKVLAADLNGNGAYQLWSRIKDGYKGALASAITLCGSADKAWEIKSAGIGAANDKEHPLVGKKPN